MKPSYLKPVAATLLGMSLVTNAIIPNNIEAHATTKKVKKVTTGVKITKSGKLVSAKSRKAVKGLVSYRGIVYKSGKRVNGLVYGNYYKNGKKATGLNKGTFYKNGTIGTGTYKGVYYSKGKKAIGLFNHTYYKNGIKGTGYYQDLRYFKGKAVNGLLDDVLYKKGKPVNGLVNDLYYIKGKVASGEYNGVFYENGKELTDVALQAKLDVANNEFNATQIILKQVQQQQIDLEAIAKKLGASPTFSTQPNFEDIADFIAANKDKTSYTEEERKAAKEALAKHQETIKQNLEETAKRVVTAAESLTQTIAQIAQISKDEKTVAAAKIVLEEVKKVEEHVKAITGITVDYLKLDQDISKADAAFKNNPVKPVEPSKPEEKPSTPGANNPGEAVEKVNKAIKALPAKITLQMKKQ